MEGRRDLKKKWEFTEKEYMEIYQIFKKISRPENVPTFDRFKLNIDKFIELTYDAYIPNIGSKDEAFIKWVNLLVIEKLPVYILELLIAGMLTHKY